MRLNTKIGSNGFLATLTTVGFAAFLAWMLAGAVPDVEWADLDAASAAAERAQAAYVRGLQTRQHDEPACESPAPVAPCGESATGEWWGGKRGLPCGARAFCGQETTARVASVEARRCCMDCDGHMVCASAVECDGVRCKGTEVEIP